MTARDIILRDYNDVLAADIVLVNLNTFGCPRPLLGTIFELAWVWQLYSVVILMSTVLFGSVESLHRPLDAHPLAAFLGDERLDCGEAGERVQRSAVRAASAANLGSCEFHQSLARAFDGNRIDHGIARIALDLGHVTMLHNHPESVAIRFVPHDQVAPFVFHIGQGNHISNVPPPRSSKAARRQT